jgi:hypothetical protein
MDAEYKIQLEEMDRRLKLCLTAAEVKEQLATLQDEFRLSAKQTASKEDIA